MLKSYENGLNRNGLWLILVVVPDIDVSEMSFEDLNLEEYENELSNFSV